MISGTRGILAPRCGRADGGAGRRDPANDAGRVHRLRSTGTGEV